MSENEKPQVPDVMASGEALPQEPRGMRTQAVVVDDAAKFEVKHKCCGPDCDHSQANEAGDRFPEESGTKETNKSGEGAGLSGVGDGGNNAALTGPTGRSNPRGGGARQNIHRLRHMSPMIRNARGVAPGVIVVCPSGSQLKAGKRTLPNDKCPCGSGKKYKKCCLNKG